MAVTRSSVISLQGKQGLPKGNQIVGWLTLGMDLLRLIWKLLFTFDSTPVAHAICTPLATE